MANPKCRNSICRKRFVPSPHRTVDTQFYCCRPCAVEQTLRLKRKRAKPSFHPPEGFTGKWSLSDAQKLEARERYWLLGDTQALIAQDLLVSRGTIGRAVKAGPPEHTTGLFKLWEVCPRCGVKFKPDRTKANSQAAAQLYCSRACESVIRHRRYRARKRAIRAKLPSAVVTCKHCGTTFPPNGVQRYCTPACQKEAKQIRHNLARRKGVHAS